MAMTERIARLREESRAAVPTLSTERAVLVTEFHSRIRGPLPAPLLRALIFRHLMEQKAVFIGSGELIVGEKGPSPKAAPTYPELCCHSLDDLEILDSRDKTAFHVTEEARNTYAQTIIPYWQGRSMRELLFQEMTDEWKDAYEAGVFTEFMEQRSPGHTVLDEKIYGKGMLDFREEIGRRLKQLDYFEDPAAYDKQVELKAMQICAEALVRYAERHADKARQLAADEADARRQRELESIAQTCSRVPAKAPRTFWDAVQYYWFVHLGVTVELNPWDAFCPGHLDQHLYPFYAQEVAAGTLTAERAEELLQCLWIKFDNQPAPPKVGVTAQESSTYTDFVQINLGGLKADGSDGVNDLSYLMLDVIRTMRQVQPNPSVQVSKRSPDRFVEQAVRVIREGMGKPDLFNCDLVVQELIRQGKSLEDARAGGTSGCVETGAFGKESYILTGYFNLPKVLEFTLNNGLDPQTGKQIGLATGDPAEFAGFSQLFEAYRRQLQHFVDIKVRGNNVIEQLYARHMPVPFLSLLTDDCITVGKDYHQGGARYNTNYIQGVGLGTMTDALTAIKYHAFDQKTLTMAELLEALRTDFEGEERLRQLLLNRTPKYGNDDDYADGVMVDVFDAYFDVIDGRPTPRGGTYRINMLPTTVHVYFGSVVGATPDGRKAGRPLSEGVSPVQGADRNGPTAVLKSVAKMDHVRTGGTLLNQKFTPRLLESDTGLRKLVQLIRTYFRMDGHHVQFNIVDREILEAAQEEPERYRDLIVRVAGYSDYFCDLSRELQDEIIQRTEHQSY